MDFEDVDGLGWTEKDSIEMRRDVVLAKKRALVGFGRKAVLLGMLFVSFSFCIGVRNCSIWFDYFLCIVHLAEENVTKE